MSRLFFKFVLSTVVSGAEQGNRSGKVVRAHSHNGIGAHVECVVFQLVDRTLDERIIAVEQVGIPVAFVTSDFTDPAALIEARKAGGENADLVSLRQ